MKNQINSLDAQYCALLTDILENGNIKGDRTGTGTVSVFSRHIKFNMSEGFPLLTTKKMAFKSIVTELLWFIKGDTNIKYLVDNNCNIWNGDAYKKYTQQTSANTSEHNKWMRDNGDGTLSMFTMEEFVDRIKTDKEFADRWGQLGPIYGKQWRNWEYGDLKTYMGDFPSRNSIDQFKNLIHDLKTNPDSRRLMVNAWNVAEISKMTLPPCHYGFQCYTRELTYEERYIFWYKHNFETGLEYNCDESKPEDFDNPHYTPTPTRALSLEWIQRSVDTLLGLPFNIASYGLLLTLLAKEVNMIPDQLSCSLGDTHLYSNHLTQAEEQRVRTGFNLPRLIISSMNDFNIFNLTPSDIKLVDYQSDGVISAPLSN